jgi:pimeloyl-ACP methyl ester carboxylesterase
MDFIEDVCTVVEYIQSEPVLIGFSMGGRVAQKYAEGYSVKGLVLLNSTEPKGTMPRTIGPETLKKIPPVVTLDRDALMRSIGEEISPELFERLLCRMSKESGKVIKEMMAGIEVDPSKISCPVLVIDTDSPGKCDRLASFYNAESVFLEGISHAGVIWGSRWGEIAEIIKDWLLKKF